MVGHTQPPAACCVELDDRCNRQPSCTNNTEQGRVRIPGIRSSTTSTTNLNFNRVVLKPVSTESSQTFCTVLETPLTLRHSAFWRVPGTWWQPKRLSRQANESVSWACSCSSMYTRTKWAYHLSHRLLAQNLIHASLLISYTKHLLQLRIRSPSSSAARSPCCEVLSVCMREAGSEIRGVSINPCFPFEALISFLSWNHTYIQGVWFQIPEGVSLSSSTKVGKQTASLCSLSLRGRQA